MGSLFDHSHYHIQLFTFIIISQNCRLSGTSQHLIICLFKLSQWRIEESRSSGWPGHVPGVPHQHGGQHREEHEDEPDDGDQFDGASDVAREGSAGLHKSLKLEPINTKHGRH